MYIWRLNLLTKMSQLNMLATMSLGFLTPRRNTAFWYHIFYILRIYLKILMIGIVLSFCHSWLLLLILFYFMTTQATFANTVHKFCQSFTQPGYFHVPLTHLSNFSYWTTKSVIQQFLLVLLITAELGHLTSITKISLYWHV